ERKLQAALQNMNCTKIIVAQRLTTAKDADRVLVLDQGGIAGLGTYDELAESCEVFRRIAESQNKGEAING
ncbi:MAG: ABC transporter ATP-binding protein, partial [Abditibacteriota bacterium]|nr:ABC transporter ATP-binding protein [Abditibacteriota bacterium]